ncbi:MAG TPA: DUF1501 domain-containing protein [Phycisphaerales bacterium]|nr:DUF1501 domain-containing protein [Phycisphaerales bacterium]
MTSEASSGCSEYQELSRRHFLQAGTGLAAFLAAHAWVPRVAYAKSHRGGARDVIVSIYLRGAADGLTLCVPYADNAYYSSRPTIAIPRPDTADPNRCTALDARFGLCPAMASLLPAYQDGKLLFVHATGSMDPSRSHFEAQRFMETGKPGDQSIGTGWLGRHLSTVGAMIPGAPLRGVGIAAGLQKALVGGPDTLPISNLDAFGITGPGTTLNARRAALTDLYNPTPDPLHSAALSTLTTIDMLNTINFTGYTPANGAVYPGNSGFPYAMKTTAALIRAEVGVEAVAIDVGSWDTHDNQGTITGSMANLMSTLSQTLAAFYRDVVAGNGPNVTVVVMSEFGRRLLENGNLGTDHGHGNVMMVLGQCVGGGRVMTQWPGLEPQNLFEGRDLQVTIDYRDILSEIVQDRLGNNNLASVFPEYTPTMRGVFTC